MHHMEERQDLQSILLPTGFRGTLSAGDMGKLCRRLVMSFPSKIQYELKHPVFMDNLKICAHLTTYAQINVRDYCRGSSADEQVTHGDLKGERSQEVTDEMASQPSVKYGEEKVEMRCDQWYFHKNIIGHIAGSCYNLNTTLCHALLQLPLTRIRPPLRPSCYVHPAEQPGFSLHPQLYLNDGNLNERQSR